MEILIALGIVLGFLILLLAILMLTRGPQRPESPPAHNTGRPTA